MLMTNSMKVVRKTTKIHSRIFTLTTTISFPAVVVVVEAIAIVALTITRLINIVEVVLVVIIIQVLLTVLAKDQFQ